MDSTKKYYLGEISTILISVASILLLGWLLSSPINRNLAFQDIKKKKAIVKDGYEFQTVNLVEIDMVWYVMDRDSSLEGKFKNIFPEGEIIQLENPETGIFEPVKE